MSISILDDDGRPDPDRVKVNRMLDRFAREGEPGGPDKAPQLRAIGAELTSRILDLESRVAELEAVPTAGHADDDWGRPEMG